MRKCLEGQLGKNSQSNKNPERVVFQKEGVKNGPIAVEKLCSLRPLELTFRLDKMEVTGDFDEQFHWNNKDKCLAGVDQRGNAQFFPGVLT